MTLDKLLVVVASLLMLGGWAGLLFLVPRQLTSLFRYRLWRLRDEIVDAIYRGDLPKNAATRDLLVCVEASIAHAAQMTLMRFWLLPPVPAWLMEERRTERMAALAGMSPPQRAFFDKCRTELLQAYFKHLIIGAPSGWLFCVATAPLVLVRLACDPRQSPLKRVARPVAAAYEQARRKLQDLTREKVLKDDRLMTFADSMPAETASLCTFI